MGKELEEDENYKLFSKDDKAKAFDEIAKKFYLSNFGSTAKSDIETLMFSIYIERILDEVVFIDKGKIILASDSDELRDREKESIDEVFRRMFKC